MTIETKDIQLPPLQQSSDPGQPLCAGTDALPFIGGLKVRLTAQLGSAELTVAELTSLKAGALVPLDRLLNQPLDLLAEGHVVAQGTLVAVGEHFGVRITAISKLV